MSPGRNKPHHPRAKAQGPAGRPSHPVALHLAHLHLARTHRDHLNRTLAACCTALAALPPDAPPECIGQIAANLAEDALTITHHIRVTLGRLARCTNPPKT